MNKKCITVTALLDFKNTMQSIWKDRKTSSHQWSATDSALVLSENHPII